MRHLLILISLLSTLSFIGCRDESDAIYLIDRAESLLKSDPDSSHILLDSIAVPDNLSDKLLARWCMLSGKVADTLYTDLPYVQQLLRAQAYYKSHGTKQEQAKIGLYLGRSYVEDKENEKAMKVYLLAYRSVHSEEEYRKRQEDLKTDEMVRQEIDQALKSFAGLPEQHIASGETDRILEDLTREYHRSTGS